MNPRNPLHRWRAFNVMVTRICNLIVVGLFPPNISHLVRSLGTRFTWYEIRVRGWSKSDYNILNAGLWRRSDIGNQTKDVAFFHKASQTLFEADLLMSRIPSRLYLQLFWDSSLGHRVGSIQNLCGLSERTAKPWSETWKQLLGGTLRDSFIVMETANSHWLINDAFLN